MALTDLNARQSPAADWSRCPILVARIEVINRPGGIAAWIEDLETALAWSETQSGRWVAVISEISRDEPPTGEEADLARWFKANRERLGAAFAANIYWTTDLAHLAEAVERHGRAAKAYPFPVMTADSFAEALRLARDSLDDGQRPAP